MGGNRDLAAAAGQLVVGGCVQREGPETRALVVNGDMTGGEGRRLSFLVAVGGNAQGLVGEALR